MTVSEEGSAPSWCLRWRSIMAGAPWQIPDELWGVTEPLLPRGFSPTLRTRGRRTLTGSPFELRAARLSVPVLRG